MNKKQKEILDKIISDRTSGSSEILTKLNKFLLFNFEDKSLILESLSAVDIGLSHFAVINKYINELNSVDAETIIITGNENLKKLNFTFSDSVKHVDISNNRLNKLENLRDDRNGYGYVDTVDISNNCCVYISGCDVQNIFV